MHVEGKENRAPHRHRALLNGCADPIAVWSVALSSSFHYILFAVLRSAPSLCHHRYSVVLIIRHVETLDCFLDLLACLFAY